MLGFYFIRDDQVPSVKQLNFAGGITEEEFDVAQQLEVIESHLNYYGKFRGSNERVKFKKDLIAKHGSALLPGLTVILKQAFVADCGLLALGD